jgi:hypothetical protein
LLVHDLRYKVPRAHVADFLPYLCPVFYTKTAAWQAQCFAEFESHASLKGM